MDWGRQNHDFYGMCKSSRRVRTSKGQGVVRFVRNDMEPGQWRVGCGQKFGCPQQRGLGKPTLRQRGRTNLDLCPGFKGKEQTL